MRTRARLVGLGATLALLVLVVGLPLLLIAVGGNPIPAHLPAFDQIRTALTSPDDGSLALGAIRVVAWVAWATFAWAILLEVVAHLRGVQAPHLPGLRVPQVAARQLVAAAALLFAVIPAGAAVAAAPSAYAAEQTATQTLPAPAATSPAGAASTTPATQGGPVTYTVQRGDSLSKIAARELGDANLWPAIVELNPAVADDPSLIYSGTQLQLPSTTTTTTAAPAAAAAAGEPRTYTVQPGDSLSKIAARELGDPARWPEIFRASKDTVQADGRTIFDPGQIDVGQLLTIPATATTAPPSPAGAAASTAATPTTAPAAAPIAPPTAQATAPTSSAPAAARTPVVPASSAQPTITAASERPQEDTATATPTPSAVPTGATLGQVGGQDEHTLVAPWMLAGLTGAGALLAGSLWAGLARRRRAQFRTRQPGCTLAAPAPVLGPVEKTITAVGTSTTPTLELLDAVLRRLGAAVGHDRAPMPDLAAVQLTATGLVLHLGAPADLSAPWTGSPDGYRWQVPATVDLDAVGPAVPDQPAPYSLLATIGEGERGDVWLFNFEDLDVRIGGDRTWAGDFARYVAAELATSPWASTAAIDLVGLGAELTGLDSERLHVHQADDVDDPIGEALADAVSTIDRASDAGADVVTARAWQVGIDSWAPRLLLVDAGETNPALDRLLDLVATHQGRTATCVVVNGSRPSTAGGVAIELTATGRVHLPDSGLDLIAVGLTADEAQGIASLMAAAETSEHVPVPVDEDATDGWRAHVDAAGALRPELTTPRGTTPSHTLGERDLLDVEEESTTLLDQPDDTYLSTAATTAEDLQVLAPMVSAQVRRDVEDADPTLDRDLAMWQSDNCPLPRLRLLGPVRASTRGKALAKRKAYFTELLTFIALHPNGATAAEVAEAFSITPAKTREYVRIVREWLGVNPRTGAPLLPDARVAPGAARRGEPVYQVVDLLVDLDLFRRLRARGQARGAVDGMADLRAALALVDGRPFDTPTQRRAGGGWTWLIDGDRHDEHSVVAVVDVAHLVCTHDVAAGLLVTARLAAETASLAAPYDEMARLDLAAVASAEGRHAEASAILRDDIANRSDDGGAPTELPARTEQILTQRPDWLTTKAS